MSPNDPAPIVIGQPPNVPAKKRKTTSELRLFDTAHAMLKIVKRTLQVRYTGSRPYSSLRGARKSGPKKYPRINTDTTNDASWGLLE
jgi:hypothetical protein